MTTIVFLKLSGVVESLKVNKFKVILRYHLHFKKGTHTPPNSPFEHPLHKEMMHKEMM